MNKKWIWTRYIDFIAETKGNEKEWTNSKFLGEALKSELVNIYKIEKGLEDLEDI